MFGSMLGSVQIEFDEDLSKLVHVIYILIHKFTWVSQITQHAAQVHGQLKTFVQLLIKNAYNLKGPIEKL